MNKQLEPRKGGLYRAFDVLSDPIRCRVLNRLNDHRLPEDVTFTLEELAVYDSQATDQVRRELHHIHLPKLADAGFVEWTETESAIRRGPYFHEISELIRLLELHPEKLPTDWP